MTESTLPVRQTTVTEAKDLGEALDLVADIVKAVMEKKPAAQIAAQEIPALMKALEGAENIPAGVKSEFAADTVALFIGKVVKTVTHKAA